MTKYKYIGTNVEFEYLKNTLSIPKLAQEIAI